MNNANNDPPEEPCPPQSDGQEDEYLWAFGVVMGFSFLVLFIIFLAATGSVPAAATKAFWWAIPIAGVVSAIVFTQHYLPRKARWDAYVSQRASYEREHAAWAAKEAVRIKQLAEAEAQLKRDYQAVMARDRARRAAEEAARLREEEARQAARAYEYAVAVQAEKTKEYLAAFNAAYSHVKYEAGLLGVVKEDDVQRVFEEAFQHLPKFQEPDAGLLRRCYADSRVGAICHALPPLPLPPKMPIGYQPTSR